MMRLRFWFWGFLLKLVSGFDGFDLVKTCVSTNMYGAIDVHCDGIDSEYDLTRNLNSFRSVGPSIYSLTFSNLMLPYIPSNALTGLSLEMLTIEDSALFALTDTDVAFEGLEETLKTLVVERCFYSNDWDLSVLKNLNKLSTLKLSEGYLEQIDGFTASHNMKRIDFSNQKLSVLADGAFENLLGLISLKLHHNELKHLKRSMLPNPASIFDELDISYNDIASLPDDIFTNMPVLQYLNIAHNDILVLDEKTFKPVWGVLLLFDARGNDLVCDCRLYWTLFYDNIPDFNAYCTYPAELNGLSIEKLFAHQLNC